MLGGGGGGEEGRRGRGGGGDILEFIHQYLILIYFLTPFSFVPDSPNKNDSIGNRNSSNGANKIGSGDSSPKEPTSGKRAFASLRSNTPVFAVPTSNLKGDREFKLDFNGVGLT